MNGKHCCAYCTQQLDPFQRCYCATCCPGAGPLAPWFSCHECAEQRDQASGAGPSRSAASQREAGGGGSMPCFEPGHRFAQVVNPQSGWLMLPPATPEQDKEERLLSFLQDYPVGQSPQGVAWIAVHSGVRAGSKTQEEDVKGALADWEAEKQFGNPCWQTAQQIGRRRGILFGKWMVCANEAADDGVWEAVARAVYVEGLCHSAKIAAGPLQGTYSTRVICVYTSNFQDSDDVMRVHAGLSAALRAALPDRISWPTIHYKPDIYTYLGIYHARNETNSWKIKPTIFSKKL